MKGIILAGGAGTRLYPMTKICTKQLQPVYDKPMIYYPLSVLMLGGMKDILIITTEHDLPFFKELLGTGEHLGIKIEYQVQAAPRGLPEAFILGENFIAKDNACLILGDNLFYGDLNFFRETIVKQETSSEGIAHIFAYSVSDPKAYGVVEFDKETCKVKSLEEKPIQPKSNFAIPGLYIFDHTVCERAKKLAPSVRGELEIVDLIRSYLAEDKLQVTQINRGVAWLDTGSPRTLLDASAFIGAIEERQGLKVACLEEVALRMGTIDKKMFEAAVDRIPRSPYRQYLEKLLMDTSI